MLPGATASTRAPERRATDAGRPPAGGPYTRPVATLDRRLQLDPPGFWWRAVSPVAALLAAVVGSGMVVLPLALTPVGEDGLLALAQFAMSLLIVVFGSLLLRALPDLDRRAAFAAKGRALGSVGIGLAGGVALVIGSVVIIMIGLALDPSVDDALDDAALEFEPAVWQTALLVVSLVVLAPLGEELVFRVLLLRALVRRLRFWPAALVSGALFAAAHPDGYLAWPRAVALVASGVVLAWLYRERGYPAAVTAHLTLNSIAAISVAAS